MKKALFLLLTIVFCAPLWAVYNLTASKVDISDLTVDKPNYYLDITASTSQATYHVFFDVWPKTESLVGTFSAQDGSIYYYNCGLEKDNGNQYFCEEDSEITLTITVINEDTCELSATIQAARKGSTYTYDIAPFRFEYKTGDVPPEPEDDPYRFEPIETVSQTFIGQIVNVRDNREKTGWINFNLVDSLDQNFDWIELDLVSNQFDMPVGTFTFSADSADGTFIASPGYKNRNDYPSYVAIRGTDWGEYTPYYVKEGSLTFSLNKEGDTVYVQGTLTSQHGSTFTVDVTAYNMFYVAPFPPKPKEEKELTMDSVVVTCNGLRRPTVEGFYEYEFNFSYLEDYPNLIFNLVLPTENQLTEGVYTLSEGQVYAPLLFQNQSDFNDYFFYGENYHFTEITLTLTDKGAGVWQYALDMTTDVGSHYFFTFAQDPHLSGSSTALPSTYQPFTSFPSREGLDGSSSTKILENGQIFILRDGKRYSILGMAQ
ncbi:MAG: hypothetical protein MJZ58_03015 [Paludibacteraceae bacterium]|nr:hypothetical protein [Paludibacteraceae bacterium]